MKGIFSPFRMIQKIHFYALFLFHFNLLLSEKREKKRCAHFFLSVSHRLTFWSHSSAHENKFSQIFTHFHLPHRWAFFRCFTVQEKCFLDEKNLFGTQKCGSDCARFIYRKCILRRQWRCCWEWGKVNRVNIVGVMKISSCYVNGTWMNGNSDWILFGGCFDYVIFRHFSARLRLEEESESIVWTKTLFCISVQCLLLCLLVSCLWKRREKQKSENE